jgi:hypothetical protein
MKDDASSSPPKDLFVDEQEKLNERTRSSMLQLVELDPDGTSDGWLAVVVQHPLKFLVQAKIDSVAAVLIAEHGHRGLLI